MSVFWICWKHHLPELLDTRLLGTLLTNKVWTLDIIMYHYFWRGVTHLQTIKRLGCTLNQSLYDRKNCIFINRGQHQFRLYTNPFLPGVVQFKNADILMNLPFEKKSNTVFKNPQNCLTLQHCERSELWWFKTDLVKNWILKLSKWDFWG